MVAHFYWSLVPEPLSAFVSIYTSLNFHFRQIKRILCTFCPAVLLSSSPSIPLSCPVLAQARPAFVDVEPYSRCVLRPARHTKMTSQRIGWSPVNIFVSKTFSEGEERNKWAFQQQMTTTNQTQGRGRVS